MNETRARDAICRVGRSLFDRGYAHASAGNISVRLNDGFLITATDACLGTLEPEGLSKVFEAGDVVGPIRPSKTLTLHRAIYAQDPSLRAVLHTHSTHLVALTLTGVWNPRCVVPPVTPYFVMKVGRVQHIPYRRPGDPEVIGLVTPHVLNARGVLLDRLGPVIWHRDLWAAVFALEELEETAKLYLAAGKDCAPLRPEQRAELAHHFSLPAWAADPV